MKIREEGFGLLEVMAAAVIGVIVFYGMSQMVMSTFRASRTVQSKSDFNTLVSEIRMLLSNSNQCASYLYDGQTPPVTPAHFNPVTPPAAARQLGNIMVGNAAIASASKTFPAFNLTMSLTEADPTKRVVAAGSSTYLAALNLTATNISKGFGNPVQTQALLLSLTVSTAAGPTLNEIQSCSVSTSGGGGGSGVGLTKVTLYQIYMPYNSGPTISLSMGTHKVCAINSIISANNANANLQCTAIPAGASASFIPPGNNTFLSTATSSVFDISNGIRWNLLASCWGSCFGNCSAACYD